MTAATRLPDRALTRAGHARWRTDPSLTDATGTRRMLRALGCDGYSTARIAAELGRRPRVVQSWLRYQRIDPAHAAAVAHLFARWAGVPAETNGSTVADAEQVRALAYVRRYAPAWSWTGEDMDDPQAVPTRWRRTHRAVDLYADSEPLLRAGVSIDEAARRLGVSVPALKRARERTRARERAAASAAPSP